MTITSQGAPVMDIVIPIFDDFTALDAVGPYEVLSRIGGRVRFVGVEAGPVVTDNGMLTGLAEAPLSGAWNPGVVRGSGLAGLAAAGPRRVDVDHVGLHGLAAARGRGDPRRAAGDLALARARDAAPVRRGADGA